MNLKIYSRPKLIKNLPLEVKKLFDIFGEDIRLVGGSVRDLMIKKKVGDFDFATKFPPQQIIKILQSNNILAIPTGIKFGTITAVVNGKNFEITTLRKDQNHQGRHCDVEFIDDYFLDASRRDFTINALYLDSHGSIYDYFDGISDLKKRKVRFIGDASIRIEEDFLRILRFFRFSCNYADGVDSDGLQACVKQKENIKKLSRERIRQEFVKLLASTKRENLFKILSTMKRKKIAAEIFSSSIEIKAMKQVFKFEKNPSLKLKIAVLFLSKKVNLETLFYEICATNEEKKFLRFLSLNLQSFDLIALKRLLAFYEKELIVDLYLFYLSKKSLPKISYLSFLKKFSLPKFPLSSQDFIALGFKDKSIGIAISQAKKFWADNDFKVNKEFLINHVGKK